jgi:GMP synthase-like glutamine amidotransferase
MILVLSTCSQNLSESEFVKPIEKILQNNNMKSETKHYSDDINVSAYDKVIICGTALKDFKYLEEMKKFSWIENFKGSILGICSGAQIIARAMGKELIDIVLIGKEKVAVKEENKIASGEFESYFLISKKPSTEGLIVLDSKGYMFKHKTRELYGVLFHPEVLNQGIIVNFCKL